MTDPQLTLRDQLTAAIQRAETAEQDRDAALAFLPLEFREETTGLCESVKRLADCWNNQAMTIRELLDKKMADEQQFAEVTRELDDYVRKNVALDQSCIELHKRLEAFEQRATAAESALAEARQWSVTTGGSGCITRIETDNAAMIERLLECGYKIVEPGGER